MPGTEETAAPPPAAPSAGSSPVALLLVAVLALGTGAGATWFLTQRSKPGGDAEHGAAAEAHGEGAAGASAPLVDRVLALDPFVVNVEGESFKRFLKARIELEAATPADRKAMAEQTAQLRDAVIGVLASKRLEDLEGLEGKAMLKTELLERLGDIAGPERLRSVLITEFVIQ
jgi:flagellar FliL protein